MHQLKSYFWSYLQCVGAPEVTVTATFCFTFLVSNCLTRCAVEPSVGSVRGPWSLSVPEAGWLRQCSDPWQETHTLTLTYECQKSYRVLFICFICISLADFSGKRCCTRILRGAVLQGPTAAIVRYWILGLYFCWWRSVLHILCTKSGNLKYKSKMGKQTIIQTQLKKKKEIKNSLISQIGGSQSTCVPEVAN